MSADRWEDERWAWIEVDGDVLPPEEPLPLDSDFDADDGGVVVEETQLPPGVHVETIVKMVRGKRVLVSRLARDLPDIAEYKRTG